MHKAIVCMHVIIAASPSAAAERLVHTTGTAPEHRSMAGCALTQRTNAQQPAAAGGSVLASMAARRKAMQLLVAES